MKSRVSLLLLSAVLVMGSVAAHADILTTTFAQTDDSFVAYVSTSNSSLGTQFLSCGLGVNACTGGTATLAPGQDYFIHVVVQNDCCAGGFGAAFALSGGMDVFQNGGTSTDTANDTSDFLASDAMGLGGPWQTPTLASVLESGTPYATVPGMIWSTGPHASGYIYNNSAVWNGQCEYCQVDFSTAIVTPEPSSLMLFGTGLFGLAEVVRRRIRK